MFIHTFTRRGATFAFNPHTMSVVRLSRGEAVALRSAVNGHPASEYSESEMGNNAIEELSEELTAHLQAEDFLGQPAAEAMPAGRVAPQLELVLNVAQACNLACTYCFSNNKVGRLMTAETAVEAVEATLTRRTMETHFRLSFFGGEATLNFPLMETIVPYHTAQCKKAGVSYDYFIITNAYRLTDDQIAFFGRHGFEVQVSVDGDRRTHDKYRRTHNGGGTYDRVLTNLHRLKRESGVRLSTSSVMTAENDARRVYDQLDGLGLANMKLDMVYDFHGSENASFASNRDEFARDFNEVMEGVAESVVERSVQLEKPSEYNFRQSILLLWKKKKKSRYCPAAASRIGVGADGTYYPCGAAASLQEHAIGTVEEGLDDDAREEFDLLLDVADKEPCKSCWALPLCLGGCPLTVRSFPTREHCETRKNMAETAIWAFAEIRRRNPLGFMAILDEGGARSFASQFSGVFGFLSQGDGTGKTSSRIVLPVLGAGLAPINYVAACAAREPDVMTTEELGLEISIE